jgi:hypothetical protein
MINDHWTGYSCSKECDIDIVIAIHHQYTDVIIADWKSPDGEILHNEKATDTEARTSKPDGRCEGWCFWQRKYGGVHCCEKGKLWNATNQTDHPRIEHRRMYHCRDSVPLPLLIMSPGIYAVVLGELMESDHIRLSHLEEQDIVPKTPNYCTDEGSNMIAGDGWHYRVGRRVIVIQREQVLEFNEAT